MRGKGRLRFSGFGASGITPAYAGKSTSFRQLPYSCQDHPRLCGEKFSNFHSLEFAPGSPPPMRGKVPAIGSGVPTAGITPAYAGKSEADVQFLSYSLGSPPPMRGKVRLVQNVCDVRRITPAYAGKSKCRSLRGSVR